jgi:hypothetical protein
MKCSLTGLLKVVHSAALGETTMMLRVLSEAEVRRLSMSLLTNFLMQADKLRWWSIYREPGHEIVGPIHLYIHYTTAADESNMKVQMLQIYHTNVKY